MCFLIFRMLVMCLGSLQLQAVTHAQLYAERNMQPYAGTHMQLYAERNERLGQVVSQAAGVGPRWMASWPKPSKCMEN